MIRSVGATWAHKGRVGAGICKGVISEEMQVVRKGLVLDWIHKDGVDCGVGIKVVSGEARMRSGRHGMLEQAAHSQQRR